MWLIEWTYDRYEGDLATRRVFANTATEAAEMAPATKDPVTVYPIDEKGAIKFNPIMKEVV